MIWLPIVGNYTEIDAYASVIAYADLLNQRQKPAKTYLLHAPNYSVPNSLRLPERENSVFDFKPGDQAIILDISIPEVIHQIVTDDQILELIDHHPGFESYWQEAIGERAIIEPIGAVATSIYEWWGECWDYHKMTSAVAKLLLAAILDNTLNFNATITTDRDRAAATSLAEIASTTVADFAEWYFSAVSDTVLGDLSGALLGDTKKMALPTGGTEFTFGQLTVWSTEQILPRVEEIHRIMSEHSKSWLLSVLDISAGHNYILTNSEQLTDYFGQLLRLKPTGDAYISDHLLLRKEILRKMQDYPV